MGNTYTGFRTNGGPTTYGPLKTAVTADVLEAGFIFAAVILAFSLLIILPGFNGRQTIFQLTKVVIGIFVTAAIMLSNYGQEWEVAHVSDITIQYKAGYKGEIHADMEAKIGLRSINITLKGRPENITLDEDKNLYEIVNYNERFHWDSLGWVQGRLGFGPFAGLVNREFRAAQRKGLPYPILWVAEYFTLDGEGIRFGRFYRQAGWYTHIMVWLAFPLWIITMILFCVVLHYGAYFSIITGLSLLIGNMIYASVRNVNELIVPVGVFDDGSNALLTFSWGGSFYLNLITGLFCVIIGVVIWVLHICCYETVAHFFGTDVLQEYEEYYLDPQEIKTEEQNNLGLMHTNKQARDFKKSVKRPELGANGVNGVEHIELQSNNNTSNDTPRSAPTRRYKLKSSVIGGRFQKSRKYIQRPPPPLPPAFEEEGEDEDMYVNDSVAKGYANRGMDH